MFSLAGRKALVSGIANEDSIAYGCAKAFRAQGADLAIERVEAFVRPIAEELCTDMLSPLGAPEAGQFGAPLDSMRRIWGRVDIYLHSIAPCPKQDLHSSVVECSREGFIAAMDISVYSFIGVVRSAAALMGSGGACMTGAFSWRRARRRALQHHGQGEIRARVRHALHGVRPRVEGHPCARTLARPAQEARRMGHFDELLDQAASVAPAHQLVSIDDVGAYAGLLASSKAANVTGGVHYIDGGYDIVG